MGVAFGQQFFTIGDLQVQHTGNLHLFRSCFTMKYDVNWRMAVPRVGAHASWSERRGPGSNQSFERLTFCSSSTEYSRRWEV